MTRNLLTSAAPVCLESPFVFGRLLHQTTAFDAAVAKSLNYIVTDAGRTSDGMPAAPPRDVC